MNIVFLCTKYATALDSPYLTDELAEELARQGHRVTVLLADWGREHPSHVPHPAMNRVARIVISQSVVIAWLPLTLQRVAKWVLSSARMAGQARRILLEEQPDLVVAFSPLVAMYMPVWLLTGTNVRRKFLVQWDFFPDAQVQIGMLRGRIRIALLRAFESYLMRRFSVIGCMSPKNIEYLWRHCNITLGTEVVHLPLWTSSPPFTKQPRESVRRRHGIPQDAHVFVFGGQFVSGRGIDDMLAASARLDPAIDRILLLFIGRGPLAQDIEAAQRSGNRFVKLMAGVSRSEYLTLLSACDVGVVSTIRDVSVPTFPSKTLDYLLAGLPILASVEASTDYGDFIESNGVGQKVLAGDIDGFLAAARSLAGATKDSSTMAHRCEACLAQNFSVEHAAVAVAGLAAAPKGRLPLSSLAEP